MQKKKKKKKEKKKIQDSQIAGRTISNIILDCFLFIYI